VDGLVQKPKRFDIEDILHFPLEERGLSASVRGGLVDGDSVDRLSAFPPASSRSSRRVRPALSSSRHSRTPSKFPAQKPSLVAFGGIEWPYVEGLRLDEAMHPLVLVTVGMYGQVLPNQNGAPVRIVVPWKYGFKSAKSLVRIRLTEEQPQDRVGEVRAAGVRASIPT